MPARPAATNEESTMTDDNRMTEEEAELALDAAMDAHTEMFGHCPGIPFPYRLARWVQALQEAVAAGKPVDPEPFFPSDPNVDA
jgi:surfactin synthase thioesterase subunit